jgi:hypothetical protein
VAAGAARLGASVPCGSKRGFALRLVIEQGLTGLNVAAGAVEIAFKPAGRPLREA